MLRGPLQLSILVACLLVATIQSTEAFISVNIPSRQLNAPSFTLQAKKKTGSGGKGFGKAAPEPVKPMVDAAKEIDTGTPSGPSLAEMEAMEGGFLKSVEGGSSSIPKIDDSAPVEDRTASILRDQYGLRTREEQQAAARRQEAAKEQRKKLEEWKQLAEQGEDFDLMQVLPAPVLIFIDRFLKAGVAICTVLFVLAGIGITIEAYSKTSGTPLPEDLDNFIVTVVEPNFTPGLGVLLGFSVSLGAFAAAQLSSSSSSYREDR